jgi:hypothetical protein
MILTEVIKKDCFVGLLKKTMNINYKNSIPLSYLKNKSLGNIPIFQSDSDFFNHYGHLFVSNWKKNANDFSENIMLVSKNFVNSAEKSKDKLGELFLDIMKNNIDDINIKGTFIYDNMYFMINANALKNSDSHTLSFFAFDKNGSPWCCYVNDTEENINFIWFSNTYSIERNEKTIKLEINKIVSLVFLIYGFKNFASVETNVLNPKSKTKIINCKYLNKTDFNITHLDSNWFTNLVQSNKFNVRGHFRLQPKKINDKWTRELIWISDFVKNGYKKSAKITKGAN